MRRATCFLLLAAGSLGALVKLSSVCRLHSLLAAGSLGALGMGARTMIEACAGETALFENYWAFVMMQIEQYGNGYHIWRGTLPDWALVMMEIERRSSSTEI